MHLEIRQGKYCYCNVCSKNTGFYKFPQSAIDSLTYGDDQ